MSNIKIDKDRNRKEASDRMRQAISGEKKAGNPFAERIKHDRPKRAKNITVGVTQEELNYLKDQQRLTLDNQDYLDQNHNGRTSTSDGNEASNVIALVMDLSKEMGNDYRDWLPKLVKEFKDEE